MRQPLLAALLLSLVLACWPAAAAELRRADPQLPRFRWPFDFAAQDEASVVVLEDRQQRVVRTSGRGETRSLEGLQSPRALGTDAGGLLVVVDGRATDGFRLVTYRHGRRIDAARLSGEALPSDPVDVAAKDGIAWIVDQSPARVFLFAYDGAGLGWQDLEGYARAPFSVSLGNSGEAFVTDPLGPAVLSFSPTGAYLGDLSLDGTGITRPTGIAVGPAGRVWVSDGVTGRVVCLDPAGGVAQTHCAAGELLLEDPLRLEWSGRALWVLEGRAGRLHKLILEGP